LKLAFKLIRAEVDHRNVVLRHKIEKLMAAKAEHLCCLSLRDLVFSEEVHYKRLRNSSFYVAPLKLSEDLIRQFQI